MYENEPILGGHGAALTKTDSFKSNEENISSHNVWLSCRFVLNSDRSGRNQTHNA